MALRIFNFDIDDSKDLCYSCRLDFELFALFSEDLC